MLFEYLKAITVSKTRDLPLDDYIPYLINRWLSFGVESVTPALNETVNSLGNIDKEKHFMLLLSLFPKYKRLPRFTYIKKKKKVPDKEGEDNIKMLATSLEMSQKEVIENKRLVEYYKSLE